VSSRAACGALLSRWLAPGRHQLATPTPIHRGRKELLAFANAFIASTRQALRGQRLRQDLPGGSAEAAELILEESGKTMMDLPREDCRHAENPLDCRKQSSSANAVLNGVTTERIKNE
jgi:hypothetical protein